MTLVLVEPAIFQQEIGAGDGPADIMPLFVLAIDAQDRLYIAGQGRRVEIVDGDWNYLASFERVNPGSLARDMAIFPDGGVVIAAVNVSHHTALDRYDPSHHHIDSFSATYAAGRDIPPLEESTFAGGKCTISSDGSLYFMQMAPYLIRRYDPTGILLEATSEGGHDFVEPPQRPEQHGDLVTFRANSSATGIAAMQDGSILVTSYRFDGNDAVRTLYCLYDKESRLVGRQELPDYQDVVGSSADGRVYLHRRMETAIEVVRAGVKRVQF